MPQRLAGKVALVIGAGSSGPGWGNGKATSVLFAREGAKVFAVDRVLSAVEETAKIVADEKGDCRTFQADVTQADQVEAMVKACIAAFGRIDVLHNNVGIAVTGGPVEQSEADWDKVMDVNVKSMFLTCKHVLPQMVKQGGGAIVNIASIAGIRYLGIPYISYAASKAAVVHFTKAIALQYAPQQIRANAILPGLMDTPMIYAPLAGSYGGTEKMVATRNRMVPMGHMGDAWDVAHAALFLASDEAKYITAAELVVDGGLTAQVGRTD